MAPLRLLPVLLILSLLTPFSTYAVTREFTISGSVSFSSTGIVLKKGQKATLQAGGTVSYGSGNPSCSGSHSVLGCSAETICPVPGACGALVGRVGGGTPFLVGLTNEVTGPGLLELGVNDVPGAFGDNTGSFEVRVTFSLGNVVTGSVSNACDPSGLGGVKISATRNDTVVASATTNDLGQYSIRLKKNGRYTLTPRKKVSPPLVLKPFVYKFKPAQKTLKMSGSDIPNVNFVIAPARNEKATLTALSFSYDGSGVLADGGTLKICNPFSEPFEMNAPTSYIVNRELTNPVTVPKGCSTFRLKHPDNQTYFCKELEFIEDTRDVIGTKRSISVYLAANAEITPP